MRSVRLSFQGNALRLRCSRREALELASTLDSMRPGVVYFSQFLAFAAPGRFASVFFSAYGLSTQQIGIVLTLPVIGSLLTATPSSALADYFASSKPRLLVFINGFSSLVLQALPLVPTSSQRERFVTAMILFTTFRVIRAPIGSICDAYALEWLERTEGVGAEQSEGNEVMVRQRKISVVLEQENIA